MKEHRSKTDCLDVPDATDGMRTADANRLRQALRRYEERPFPVTVKLRNDGGRKWSTSYLGDDQDTLIGRLRMHAAFASMSQDFIDTMMGDLLGVWDNAGGITEKRYNAALAIIEAATPQNELEAMLVIQMIVAHEASLRATSMIGAGGMFHQAMGFGNLANKFMRTFTTQSEALAKLRRGGEQVVKYVHVHEGGQAVVAGTINQNGGRQNLESCEQPYGAETATPCAALPSADPMWDGVPVPRNDERPLPVARR